LDVIVALPGSRGAARTEGTLRASPSGGAAPTTHAGVAATSGAGTGEALPITEPLKL
jgi:hypothetical protein